MNCKQFVARLATRAAVDWLVRAALALLVMAIAWRLGLPGLTR